MLEVDQDGDIVWTYDGAGEQVARAQRYGGDHPGIIEHLGTPIVNNSLVSSGNNLSLNNYPNPFTKTTTIRFNNNNQKTEISIFNMNGKKVLQEIVTGNSFKWDASELRSGIYLLKVKNSSKVFIKNINLIK